MTTGVTAYRKVGTFLIGKNRWWVLKSGDMSGVVLTKTDNVFLFDREKKLYSLLYDKTASFTTSKSKNALHLVIMDEFRITTVRKGGLVNDSYKKNATKI